MTVLQNGAEKFELALGTYREIFEADQNSNVKWIDSSTVYSSVSLSGEHCIHASSNIEE